MSLRDDINIPVVVVLGVTTGLIVAVAIIGTQAGYNYVSGVELSQNYAEADAAGRLRYGENIWRPRREALAAAPSWADVNKSSVRIPIDEAKRLMLDSQGKPPAVPTTQGTQPEQVTPTTAPAGR